MRERERVRQRGGKKSEGNGKRIRTRMREMRFPRYTAAERNRYEITGCSDRVLAISRRLFGHVICESADVGWNFPTRGTDRGGIKSGKQRG